jgi:hypothetical protein
MTPIQNSIAYIQGFEFGQDIAKKEIRLAVEAEREWLLGYIQEHQPSYEQIEAAIRARGEQA